MMKNGAGGTPATAAGAGAPGAEPTSGAHEGVPVVEVTDLHVSRGGKEILHGLGLSLAPGTVTGLLGPSGCGKTTLMRTLVGVQRYRGRVSVLGHTPGDPAVRGRVGYVTQGLAVYKDLTARQNLTYFARLAGARARDPQEVLDLVGLADIADRPVSSYSGGEAGRVSLACALVARPDLLVMDEPTVGLDPLTREDLWERFRAMAQEGTTLLVSSHVMDEAFRCDQVLLMREGHLLACTTAPGLLEDTGATTVDEAFLAVIARDSGWSDSAVGAVGDDCADSAVGADQTSREASQGVTQKTGQKGGSR
ncbi:ABC transporter ATP-binding protein [Actinomyces wuliandei]|uniref:ABC transporter ATP-binding protein n=1 Tax=Actinomyces wuliandei TaxID=2057743 RepID=UPI000FD7EAAF|nr:ABC transporter ATP-binding protein [Actinomyces wuliandei]